jgi:hypothetical protein
MDTRHSTLKVRVFKSGMFSAFAHDHEIEAPIAQGSVSLSTKPSIELRVDARKLRVLDPKLSAKNRADVQKTMEGPQVLDSNRFTEVSFHSTVNFDEFCSLDGAQESDGHGSNSITLLHVQMNRLHSGPRLGVFSSTITFSLEIKRLGITAPELKKLFVSSLLSNLTIV